VEYLDLRPGAATVALTLTPEMLNFRGFPHGGVIFSLADVAFSAACNAAGEPAVAVSMTITFLAAAAAGSRLIAEARGRRRRGRTGFYDVGVRTAQGVEVARAQCVSHRVAGGRGRRAGSARRGGAVGAPTRRGTGRSGREAGGRLDTGLGG
jgi:acyl-CoA thioesterase